MRYLLVLCFALCVGCTGISGDLKQNSTWPGIVSVTNSEVDGSYTVRMNPAYIYESSKSKEASMMLRMGWRWSSVIPDTCYFVTEGSFDGVFEPGSELLLVVDGVKKRYPPVNRFDSGDVALRTVVYGEGRYSAVNRDVVVEKEFSVPCGDIVVLMQGKTVVGRLWANSGFVDFSLKSVAGFDEQKTSWLYSTEEFLSEVAKVESHQ